MFINDILNRDDVCDVVINELRKCGVKYRKEKKFKHNQGKKFKQHIFSTPLHLLELTDVILMNGGVVQVPKIVSDACQIILDNVNTEGLFRKAGSNARQKEIKASLEAGFQLEKSYHEIDVANILKTFFRDLPEPLLPPGNIQDALIQCLLCGKQKIEALLMTCLLLPAITLNTLSFFMQFLHTISLYSETNKMSAHNLAIIFAPGLMPLTELTAYKLNNHVKIITLLINNAIRIGELSDQIQMETEGIIHGKITDEKIGLRGRSQDKRKSKKRRSGSLTRMLSGLRKIVSVIGPNEETAEPESNNKSPESSSIPCLNKSGKKRKILESQAFSAKKKKNVLVMQNLGSFLPFTPNTLNYLKIDLSNLYRDKKDQELQLSDVKKKPSQLPPLSLQRRWSFLETTSLKQQKSNDNDNLYHIGKNYLSPITSLPYLNLENLTDNKYKSFENKTPARRSDFLPRSNNILVDEIANNVSVDIVDSKDYVKIPKAEYEAIKDRVSAIETRMSMDFNNEYNFNSSSDDNTNNQVENLVQVQSVYEKTLEKTEHLANPHVKPVVTRRLSRELKMIANENSKVLRSPSARKIGSLRRRSRENTVRLSRHDSFNIIRNFENIDQQEKFESESLKINISPDLSELIKSNNLRRGRPNTLQTGLRYPSPVKKLSQLEIALESDNKDMEWVSANEFFSTLKSHESNIFSVTNNKDITEIPITTEDISTPMRPPKIPPRKTPLRVTPAHISTSHKLHGSVIKNKHTYIISPENPSGRASIVRIRNQNAGMVMAKAKLFDDLLVSVDNVNECHNQKFISQPSTTKCQNIKDDKHRFSLSKKLPLQRQIQIKNIEKQIENCNPLSIPKSSRNCIKKVIPITLRKSNLAEDIVTKMKNSCNVKDS